jgi:lipopolysaccharide biosynthesis regulator YciM
LDIAEDLVPNWMAALERYCEGNPAVEADGLDTALGERKITSPTLSSLAVRAAFRLVEVQRFDQASARILAAQQFDPNDPQLVALADVIAQVRGDPVEERLARVEAALSAQTGDRRLALLALRASVERSVFGLGERELATWLQVTQEDPASTTAHQSLCEIYKSQSNNEALESELHRALQAFPNETKDAVRWQLASFLASSQRTEAALDLYRELVQAGQSDSNGLAQAADLAEKAGDAGLQRLVLDRRVDTAKTPVERARAYETLGAFLLDREDTPEHALDCFRKALGANFEERETKRARALGERILAVAPNDSETAALLLQLAFQDGDFEGANAFFDSVAKADATRARQLLRELEPVAKESGNLAELLPWLERLLLEDSSASTADARPLLVQRAHWLASIPERIGEAGDTWQKLIDSYNDDQDIACYEEYLVAFPDVDLRREGQRWLLERRVSAASDPTEPLLDWAHTEAEDFGDIAAAIALCERAIESRPDEVKALELLAALRLQTGAADEALQALLTLRRYSAASEHDGIDLRIAQLLFDQLDRREEAYETLEPLLRKDPLNEAAIAMTATLTEVDRLGPRIAALFEEIVQLWKTAGIDSVTIFERLQTAAVYAAPASKLWNHLEELGVELDRAEAVIAVYTAAISHSELPETLQALGQRMVAFAEQWAPDPAAYIDALLHILEVCPLARWALNRVTFVLSQQGRFTELMDWFDRAIQAEASPEARHSLLDEAVVTARDLAKDYERAIGYLERQCAERPDDAKAQASLERLYRRGGYTRKLIELLTHRLKSLVDPERAQVEAHIATRWLELGAPERALEVTECILERRPGDTSGLELLERIVDSMPDDNSASASSAAQLRAAQRLCAHYMTREQYPEAARVLESELHLSLAVNERSTVLHELADLQTNQLNDFRGAFRILIELITLEPQVPSHRQELEELAARLGAHREHAEALVRIALESKDTEVSALLLLEALRVFGTQLDEPEREAQLHEQLLLWANDEPTILTTLCALDRLYTRLQDSANLCRVLEFRAAREPTPEIQLYGWRGAARLALFSLNEPVRANADWRKLLEHLPNDQEALDGLIEGLGRLEQPVQLIDALEQRAAQADAVQARTDLVRAAHLALSLGNTTRALTLWQRVANRFGDDQECALAIADLLEREERWLELRDHLHEYSQGIPEAEQRAVLMRAAAVELTKMQDSSAAIGSYIKAHAWPEAVGVVEAIPKAFDRAKVALGLIDLADAAWKSGDAQAEVVSFQATLIYTRCSLPSVESMNDTSADLVQSTKLLRRVTQVRDRLVTCAQRPFGHERRRALLLEAARVTWNWLREPIETIRLYASLFAEDPIDAAAEQSFEEYSELLSSQCRFTELAELFERRALAAPEGSPGALGAWLKAGELWEAKVRDPARALGAHRHAAESESIPALEAVARLARQLGHAAEAARALERLVAHAGNLAPIERVIELVDAYFASGDLGRARVRLEATLQAAWHPEIDQRLENLYRRTQQWGELVELLKLRSGRQEANSARVSLLREAAELQLVRLGDAAAAVDTLAAALVVEPERTDLELELARACSAAGQHEKAVSLLQHLIDAFGSRRSRARAELHAELSSVLTALGQTERAFEELRTAASIDQAQPRVLYELGKSALLQGAFDLADQTISSLLLLLHRAGGEAQGVGQVHAYLVLAEIATRRGDTVRSRDYIESAFETALESPEHERRLLAALVELDKPALVQRALELRWSHVTDATERCALLRDRLQVPVPSAELGATREKLERRARETWARLDAASPARAFRDLSEVFEWLGDHSAAAQSLHAFADRVDWSKADPSDAGALLQLAQQDLKEGLDFSLVQRHLEGAIQLGVELPALAQTLELVLAAADQNFVEPERRAGAVGLCQSLVDAVAAAAPSVNPTLGVSLLLRLVELAERLELDDVADRALAAATSLGPNREVLLAQLRRLKVKQPDSPERWQLTEQLLAVETGAMALQMGVEIARNAHEHHERARAARALSKVLGFLHAGAEPTLEVVELLAWSGLPERAIDLLEAASGAWLDDDALLEQVASSVYDGVLNLELQDRLHVELRFIDWLTRQRRLETAFERLTALSHELSDTPAILERLAQVALQLGRAEEAIRAQKQLVDLSSEPSKLPRIFTLFETCERLGRPSMAQVELEQAHLDNPDNPDVTQTLIRLYEKMGAHVELAQLLIATASGEGNSELVAEVLVRAAHLVRTDSPDRAMEYLERAEHLRPNVPAELELARHYAAQGRTQNSIAFYSLVANSADPRYAPERANAHCEVAQLHLGVDQLAEAHEALCAAFRFRAKNAAVAWQLAQLALDLNDDDGAKRALRAVVGLKSGPEDGEDCVTPQTKSKAYYYLGRMMNWQGDAAGARRMIGRAIEEDPTNDFAQRLQVRLA